MLLKLVRLIRFILRFVTGAYLMIMAAIGWLCRKRVKKGRPQGVDQEMAEYDGVPLAFAKERNDHGTPQFERVRIIP